MDKIKSFGEFVTNESFMGADNALAFLGGVLKGKIDIFGSSGVSGTTTASTTGSGGTTTTIGTPGTYTPSGTYTATSGNDDFALYMQHQQGVAGATGIVKALNGTGKMHPDTIRTKKGVKYANLVQNVPSDRPQIKKDLIGALDKGDQRTAAGLFLNMWKEKWFSRQKRAKIEINNPANSVVKDAITKASTKHKLPFDFAITVAHIESGLNPKSGGPVYKGLLQCSQIATTEEHLPLWVINGVILISMLKTVLSC